MGQPYIGEIRMFGGNFPPNGWAFCDGQSMPISENDVLFQLIGTTYGGDGQETFNLPDMRGRAPVHMGTLNGGGTYQIGELGGQESVTLNTNQIPAHNHLVGVSTAAANASTPGSTTVLSTEATTATGVFTYAPAGSPVTLSPATVGISGGFQPHENMQRYQAVNFIISLYGVFPSQT